MNGPIDLSVVATSRNDDHGGNLAARTQYFIDGLADVADREDLSVELVLVEWNPPRDRAPLVDTLRAPASQRFHGRVVTVPEELHHSFRHADALPLFQMIAKNVGIRRSRGPMVLATNVDVVMSTALAAQLRACTAPRTIYRCDRADVVFDVGGAASVDLECVRDTEPLRVNREDGVHYPGVGRVVPNYRGLGDALAYRAGALIDRRRRPRGGRLVPAGIGLASAPAPTIWGRIRDRWSAVGGLRTLPRLHGNACGDFTMVTRSGWDELRGYAEWEVHSWNLDSLLLYQAHAAGFAFVNLPSDALLLHIEQSAGSAFTPEHAQQLYARLLERGIPVLGDADLRELARALEAGRPPIPQFNGPEWGLAVHPLPEVIF